MQFFAQRKVLETLERKGDPDCFRVFVNATSIS